MGKDAVDLIMSCLRFDGSKRILPNQALLHPFFRDVRNTSLDPFSSISYSSKDFYLYQQLSHFKSLEDQTIQSKQPKTMIQPSTAGARTKLIEWIYEVCDGYAFNAHTFLTAVNIMDRFMLVVEVPTYNALLIAAASLKLAESLVENSMETFKLYSIKDYSSLTDQTCTESDILSYEELIVKTLGAKIMLPTSACYLNIYHEIINLTIHKFISSSKPCFSALHFNSTQYFQETIGYSGLLTSATVFGSFILQSIAMEEDSLLYPAWMLASAALFIGIEMCGVQVNKNIIKYISDRIEGKNHIQEFRQCVELVLSNWQKLSNRRLTRGQKLLLESYRANSGLDLGKLKPITINFSNSFWIHHV